MPSSKAFLPLAAALLASSIIVSTIVYAAYIAPTTPNALVPTLSILPKLFPIVSLVALACFINRPFASLGIIFSTASSVTKPLTTPNTPSIERLINPAVPVNIPNIPLRNLPGIRAANNPTPVNISGIYSLIYALDFSNQSSDSLSPPICSANFLPTHVKAETTKFVFIISQAPVPILCQNSLSITPLIFSVIDFFNSFIFSGAKNAASKTPPRSVVNIPDNEIPLATD